MNKDERGHTHHQDGVLDVPPLQERRLHDNETSQSTKNDGTRACHHEDEFPATSKFRDRTYDERGDQEADSE